MSSDRGEAARQRRTKQALVGRKGSERRQCENALIEDDSGEGILVRSGAPLQEGDSVVLFVDEEMERLRAKVMWVRKEGLIEKRKNLQPGQAYLAGMRIKARRRATIRRKKESAPEPVVQDVSWERPVRLALITLGLIAAGTVAYLATSLLSLFF